MAIQQIVGSDKASAMISSPASIMSVVIVVGTSPGRENWVKQCLESLTRESLVVSGFGFELGTISFILESTTIERFVFIQDSVQILDNRVFDIIENMPGPNCLLHDPDCYGSYMGVYDRKHLTKILTSPAFSKEDSIRNEMVWTSEYLKVASGCNHGLGKEWKVKGYETSNGRVSQIIETKFLRKYKGDWGQIKHDGSTLDGLALQAASRLDKIADASLSSHYETLLKDHKRIQSKVDELSNSNSSLASSNLVLSSHYENILTENKRIQSKIDQLSLETNALRESLIRLYNSLSWKVTEPLRFFKGQLIKIVGGGK